MTIPQPTAPQPTATERRRTIALAGHNGDSATALAGLEDVDPQARAIALSALQRLTELTDDQLIRASVDSDPGVRRRAVTIAAVHHNIDLEPSLHDSDDSVVEVAAWACGEHEQVSDAILHRLMALVTDSDNPLVREASVAALGAIGDERAVGVIIAACSDKPAIRRRAALALAPFEGPLVDAALQQALIDRDWQVRQAAEDVLQR